MSILEKLIEKVFDGSQVSFNDAKRLSFFLG